MDFIRSTLYKLKRMHGYPILFYVRLSETVDYAVGQVSEIKARYLVRRAIVLPGELNRKFSYDIAYMAANKSFTYGALYDMETTSFIIEARDLPVEPKVGMHIIMDDNSYEISKVTLYHHKFAYIIDAKQIRDSINYALVIDLIEEVKFSYIIRGQILTSDQTEAVLTESDGLGILGV